MTSTQQVRGVRAVRFPVRFTEPAEPGATVRAEIEIERDDPVFAGHYPGFPIFPGVCIVDCVHHAALLCSPGGRPTRLVAVERSRFTGAVYPGDRLCVDLGWDESTDAAGEWLLSATARCDERGVASMRLRYREAS